MPLLSYLEPGEAFPPTAEALGHPNGLLAAGGLLDSSTLLAAYRRGIFPWYEEPQPVLWWTPDPRSVLLPGDLHISKSLRKTLRKNALRVTADKAFSQVMRGCAEPRPDQHGTWIDSAMQRAYAELHAQGWAHSVEVWDRDDRLVGGLYGVGIGQVFFGESMFSRVTDASKLAMIALVGLAGTLPIELIDCQIESPHLNSLGAKNISRLDFESRLQHTVSKPTGGVPWTLEKQSGALLDLLTAPQAKDAHS